MKQKPSSRQKPKQGVSLTSRAYQLLEELIVTLQIPPGQVLSEQTLVRKLRIGRTPIREALKHLERDGLVETMPRRGVRVSEINIVTQLKLLEVRRELERLLARLAAQRASDGEREEFHELAEAMVAAARDADDLKFMRLDRRLNVMITLAARNEFAARSIGFMHSLSRRFWYQHYKEVADLPLAATLHAKLAQAISDRGSDEAAAASDRLIDYIQKFARQALDRAVG
jgi:DNA-binding GntR family transcriptional regulator